MTLLSRLKHKPCLEDIRMIEKSIAKFNISQLSPEEYALYQLLVEGYTLKESARMLSFPYSLCKKRKKELYKKLKVKTQAELIIRYRDVGKRSEENE
jgi:DNA-binding CsgD family transcriptional regulator